MTFPCRGNPTQDEIDRDNEAAAERDRRAALSPEERQKEDDAQLQADSENQNHIGCILAVITMVIIFIIYYL